MTDSPAATGTNSVTNDQSSRAWAENQISDVFMYGESGIACLAITACNPACEFELSAPVDQTYQTDGGAASTVVVSDRVCQVPYSRSSYGQPLLQL